MSPTPEQYQQADLSHTLRTFFLRDPDLATFFAKLTAWCGVMWLCGTAAVSWR